MPDLFAHRQRSFKVGLRGLVFVLVAALLIPAFGVGRGFALGGDARSAGAWLFGLPFLTSGYWYVNLPPIEQFGLSTAALFDLGVFLTVLGAVMLMLYSLSRIARHAGESVNSGPMDFDPSVRDAAPGKEG